MSDWESRATWNYFYFINTGGWNDILVDSDCGHALGYESVSTRVIV